MFSGTSCFSISLLSAIQGDFLPRLSILILTLKSRESMFDRLLSVLGPQCEGLPVEIIVEKDDGESCIGDKRNRCLDRATGDYIAFIDDDDLVHDEYVELILNGIETGADCIGFKSLISKDGKPLGEQYWRLDNERFWKDDRNPDWIIWYRRPTHQCAVKRELALQVRFPRQNLLEDIDYIDRLFPLLKTGHFIDEHLYINLHRSYETRLGEMNNHWRRASEMNHLVRQLANLPPLQPPKPPAKQESHPDTAILIPTYGRAERLSFVLGNAWEATPDAQIYLICEPDDKPTLSIGLDGVGAHVLVPPMRLGTYAKAINFAYSQLPKHIRHIFLAADDLHFHPGWLDECKALMGDGVYVVGTNDLCNGRVMSGLHATHYLIDRHYIEEKTGTADRSYPILYEGYDHNFTDTEFIETAKSRGAFAPCLTAIVEHKHFLFGKSQKDATYEKGYLKHDEDRKIYESRKHLWEKHA
jgi:hypothetical protein